MQLKDVLNNTFMTIVQNMSKVKTIINERIEK